MAGLGVWFRGLLNTKENTESGASPAHVRPRTSESVVRRGPQRFHTRVVRAVAPEAGNLFFSPFSIRSGSRHDLTPGRGARPRCR